MELLRIVQEGKSSIRPQTVANALLLRPFGLELPASSARKVPTGPQCKNSVWCAHRVATGTLSSSLALPALRTMFSTPSVGNVSPALLNVQMDSF